jgi:hypothetical protein
MGIEKRGTPSFESPISKAAEIRRMLKGACPTDACYAREANFDRLFSFDRPTLSVNYARLSLLCSRQVKAVARGSGIDV